MPSNIARPSMHLQTASRLTKLAVIRLATTLGLTVFDWYGFRLMREPDVAPYLNHLERALLPVLLAGALTTLLHLWVLTFRAFREAIRIRHLNEPPCT